MLKFGFVGPGERETYRYLTNHLSDDWYGFALKEILVREDYVREADFVLVGQNSICVLEEKHWGGSIWGDDTRWYFDRDCELSPLNQVDDVARIIAGRLKDTFPSLATRLVQGFVVLSNPEARLTLHKNELRAAKVLHLESCIQRLDAFDSCQQHPFHTVSRDSVLGFFGRLRDRQTPTRINIYDVLESLSPIGPYRNWIAKHRASGQLRLLRAVPSSGVGDHPREQTPLVREFITLKTRLENLALEGRVPRVEDYFEWKNEFLVFPLHILQGLSLPADRRKAPPSDSKIRSVVADAFVALRDVHRMGVIHRNLGPSRIHLGERDRVAFSDFLIAKIRGAETVAPTARDIDPEQQFTAPEVACDPRSATEKSDVYSLGASLIYWISGQIPSPSADVSAILSVRTDLTCAVRETVAGILRECVALDPKSRPSAQDRADLVAVLS